ncbi:MAG: hypothetical protein FJX54_13940 [Alphaproteobacteria bacterium]|nr:hypothetical protein [Alphaproteobacteria bacterium]
MNRNPFLAIALVCSTVLLEGCERAQSIAATQLTPSTMSSGPPSAVIPPDVVRIPDIPIPPNGRVVREDTAIIGPDENWNGQVVVTTSYSAAQMTEYYRVEMPKLGWQETAVVRARRTAITFTRGDRIAMVRIAPTGEVDIVVAPSARRR